MECYSVIVIAERSFIKASCKTCKQLSACTCVHVFAKMCAKKMGPYNPTHECRHPTVDTGTVSPYVPCASHVQRNAPATHVSLLKKVQDH